MKNISVGRDSYVEREKEMSKRWENSRMYKHLGTENQTIQKLYL